ncbi:hypothetical protein EZV73_20945 [Acidaminobacter sp. JC074]|uniref:hypothetical protein n=1 Tax=Acidaminobacter sp. JC074 TaxID=2530199 RepID=UPI001F10DBA2|nr:hypothetical protein [Acidaminobacter sp. JC074]MCH4890060.1 hypothetical protein [Acidaminobacter sp. JC074]
MYESAKDLLKFYKKIYDLKNAKQSKSIDDDVKSVQDKLSLLNETISGLHIEGQTKLSDLNGYLKELTSSAESGEDFKLKVCIIGDQGVGKTTLAKFLNEAVDEIDFVDMPAYEEDALESYYYCDGLIYLINHETMYFKKDHKLQTLFKSKPNLAVLSKIDLFDDPVYMLTDARKYFEEMVSLVLPFNGLTLEGKFELINAINKRFIHEEASLKVQSVFNVTSQKIAELKRTLRDNAMLFRQGENKRITDKSDVKKSHQQLVDGLNHKIEMMLGSYEVDVKQQVNYRSKDIFEVSDKRDFVEKEIFKVDALKRDINRLIDGIENELKKLATDEEILLSVEEDDIEFVSGVELNLMLDRLNEGGLFATLQRKKKLSVFQNDLMNMMTHHVSNLRIHIEKALSEAMNQAYQIQFKRIDKSFEEDYCLVSEVGIVIRSVDEVIRALELSNIQVDLKDIILGRV